MLDSDGRLRPQARELRNNATKQENHLWYDFLRQRPEQWNRQRVIGEFIVDFYCPKAKLAIELDGMQHYTPQGLAHDEERSAHLEGLGIKVVRFKNKEIDEAFFLVCKTIAEIVDNTALTPRLLPVEGAPPAGGEDGIAERRVLVRPRKLCENKRRFSVMLFGLFVLGPLSGILSFLGFDMEVVQRILQFFGVVGS